MYKQGWRLRVELGLDRLGLGWGQWGLGVGGLKLWESALFSD